MEDISKMFEALGKVEHRWSSEQCCDWEDCADALDVCLKNIDATNVTCFVEKQVQCMLEQLAGHSWESIENHWQNCRRVFCAASVLIATWLEAGNPSLLQCLDVLTDANQPIFRGGGKEMFEEIDESLSKRVQAIFLKMSLSEFFLSSLSTDSPTCNTLFNYCTGIHRRQLGLDNSKSTFFISAWPDMIESQIKALTVDTVVATLTSERDHMSLTVLEQLWKVLLQHFSDKHHDSIKRACCALAFECSASEKLCVRSVGLSILITLARVYPQEVGSWLLEGGEKSLMSDLTRQRAEFSLVESLRVLIYIRAKALTGPIEPEIFDWMLATCVGTDRHESEEIQHAFRSALARLILSIYVNEPKQDVASLQNQMNFVSFALSRILKELRDETPGSQELTLMLLKRWEKDPLTCCSLSPQYLVARSSGTVAQVQVAKLTMDLLWTAFMSPSMATTRDLLFQGLAICLQHGPSSGRPGSSRTLADDMEFLLCMCTGILVAKEDSSQYQRDCSCKMLIELLFFHLRAEYTPPQSPSNVEGPDNRADIDWGEGGAVPLLAMKRSDWIDRVVSDYNVITVLVEEVCFLEQQAVAAGEAHGERHQAARWLRMDLIRFLLVESHNPRSDQLSTIVTNLWDAIPSEVCCRWIRVLCDSGALNHEQAQGILTTRIGSLGTHQFGPQALACNEALFGQLNSRITRELPKGRVVMEGRECSQKGMKVCGQALIARTISWFNSNLRRQSGRVEECVPGPAPLLISIHNADGQKTLIRLPAPDTLADCHIVEDCCSAPHFSAFEILEVHLDPAHPLEEQLLGFKQLSACKDSQDFVVECRRSRLMQQIFSHAGQILACKLGFPAPDAPRWESGRNGTQVHTELGKRDATGQVKVCPSRQCGESGSVSSNGIACPHSAVRLRLDSFAQIDPFFSEHLSDDSNLRLDENLKQLKSMDKADLPWLPDLIRLGEQPTDCSATATVSQLRREYLAKAQSECQETLGRIHQVRADIDHVCAEAEAMPLKSNASVAAKCPWMGMEHQLLWAVKGAMEGDDLKLLTKERLSLMLVHCFGEEAVNEEKEYIGSVIVDAFVRMQLAQCESQTLERMQQDVPGDHSTMQCLVKSSYFELKAAHRRLQESLCSADGAQWKEASKLYCEEYDSHVASCLTTIKLRAFQLSEKCQVMRQVADQLCCAWNKRQQELHRSCEALVTVEDKLLAGTSFEALLIQHKKAVKELKLAVASQGVADSDDDSRAVQEWHTLALARLESVSNRLCEVCRLGFNLIPEITSLVRSTFTRILPQSAKAILEPRTLSDYDDLEPLDENGRNLRATLRKTGQRCTLKRFQVADRTIAGLLHHANVVMEVSAHPIVLGMEAIFEDAPGTWFVQFPCLPANLHQCIVSWAEAACQHKPSCMQIVQFFIQFAQGLASLHAKGIAHCKLEATAVSVTSRTDYDSWRPVICEWDCCHHSASCNSQLIAMMGGSATSAGDRCASAGDILAFGIILRQVVSSCGVSNSIIAALLRQLECDEKTRPTAAEVVQHLLSAISKEIAAEHLSKDEMRKIKNLSFEIRVKEVLAQQAAALRRHGPERRLMLAREEPLEGLRKFKRIFDEDLKFQLTVRFLGEMGDDNGGLLREFVSLATEAVLHAHFEEHVDDGGQGCLPKAQADLELLHALGMLLNKSMQERVQLTEWHRFPRCLCRFLLLSTDPGNSPKAFWQRDGPKLGLEMQDLDSFKGATCAKSLATILVMDAASLDEMELELPCGQALRATTADREEYVKWQLFEQLLGGERWPSMVALWKGFHHPTVTGLHSCLALLHVDEVQVLLGGASYDATMELLLAMDRVVHFEAFPPALEAAVRGALAMLSGAETRQLLRHMAGLKALPMHLPQRYLNFIYRGGMSLNGLWVAHACSNTMDVPPYDLAHLSSAALYAKLKQSMTEGVGFHLV